MFDWLWHEASARLPATTKAAREKNSPSIGAAGEGASIGSSERSQNGQRASSQRAWRAQNGHSRRLTDDIQRSYREPSRDSVDTGACRPARSIGPMNAAEDLLRECRAQRSNEPTRALIAAAQAFVREALRSPEPQATVAAALRESVSPTALSWASIVLGSAVESGADPTPVGRALFEAFDRASARVVDTSASKAERDAVTDALPRLAQGVVAHLARMQSLREELATDGALLDRLTERAFENPSVRWVREAIERVSGPLVVLHPLSGKGAKLRIENVSNCFHLFSLVQCAIEEQLPGGRAARKVVVQCARGEIEAQTDDQAWWHYGDPRSPKPDVAASIWGEAAVRTIPEIDGARVLLLWPALLGSRTWDSGFFGPFLDAMPANVVFERALTDDEAREWTARLGLDGLGQN